MPAKPESYKRLEACYTDLKEKYKKTGTLSLPRKLLADLLRKSGFGEFPLRILRAREKFKISQEELEKQLSETNLIMQKDSLGEICKEENGTYYYPPGF